MADSLGYHLYRFTGKLPDELEKQLHQGDDVSFLKKTLRDSIKVARLPIDINVEPAEKSDITSLQNNIIVRKFFTGSTLEQIYIAVPVNKAYVMKDENTSEFQKRIILESDEKLLNMLGVNVRQEEFSIVSSFTFVVKDDKVFADNKSYYESISQFITQSYKINSEQYVSVNNFQIVIDYEGVGVIFPSNFDLNRVQRLIFVLMLAKAYLAALESISLGTVGPLVYGEDYIKEAEAIDKTLEIYNQFLIRYYYHNPIMVDVNKTFYVYDMMKDEFKLKEQYAESKEQIRILSEISATRSRQIAEIRADKLHTHRQQEQKQFQEILNNIYNLGKLGLAIITILLALVLLLT